MSTVFAMLSVFRTTDLVKLHSEMQPIVICFPAGMMIVFGNVKVVWDYLIMSFLNNIVNL